MKKRMYLAVILGAMFMSCGVTESAAWGGERKGFLSGAGFMTAYKASDKIPEAGSAESSDERHRYRDVVYLKDGSKIVCMIVAKDPNGNVTIRTPDGYERILSFTAIAKIKKLKFLAEDMPLEMGLTAGGAGLYPVGRLVNISVGQWIYRMNVQFAGMYYQRQNYVQYYVQSNINLLLKDTGVSSHCLGIVYQRYRGEDPLDPAPYSGSNWGGVYQYRRGGLFVEAGAMPGFPLLPLLQVGYLWKI